MDSDPFSNNEPDINGSFSLVICAILILVSIILIVVYCSREKRNAIKSNMASPGLTAGIACNVANIPISKKKQSNLEDDEHQQQPRCEWISSKKESTSIGLKVIIPESLVVDTDAETVFTYDFTIVQEQIPGVPVIVCYSGSMNRKWDPNGFVLHLMSNCVALMSDPQFTTALSVGIGPKVYHISPLPPITLSD
jgi:hypothetical protein